MSTICPPFVHKKSNQKSIETDGFFLGLSGPSWSWGLTQKREIAKGAMPRPHVPDRFVWSEIFTANPTVANGALFPDPSPVRNKWYLNWSAGLGHGNSTSNADPKKTPKTNVLSGWKMLEGSALERSSFSENRDYREKIKIGLFLLRGRGPSTWCRAIESWYFFDRGLSIELLKVTTIEPHLIEPKYAPFPKFSLLIKRQDLGSRNRLFWKTSRKEPPESHWLLAGRI